jgi:DNA-binding PadR family transcriptional regulator
MTRKIDALEKRGLVRRVRSAEDRRAIKLELTPEGRKLYPKALAIAVGMANEFLEGFTKAEVKALEGFLQTILKTSKHRRRERLRSDMNRKKTLLAVIAHFAVGAHRYGAYWSIALRHAESTDDAT